MTTNFSSLEKQHSKLIDHCKVMESDLNYYKGRVKEAEEINQSLRYIGKTNISELMDELKTLCIKYILCRKSSRFTAE